ncbi:MAG TPA: tannase/feruloyl esterase family alpha/beta hydrolase [Acetobacteraceae bacterium]|jgi:feruloyl esterase|nr:tannase/feruloyl esterase family alpha/beta hydrolase [Acetobacteraceae bacterium]
MHIRIVFAAVLLAGAATPGLAAPACTVNALNALNVPNLTVAQAAPAAASATAPAYCDVKGTVVTQGENAPDGSARFVLQLPDAWRQRFFFMGVGGNAGGLSPSVNAVDRAASLGKGYVTAVTDTGHVGNGTDATWVRTPDGKPDAAKVTDFFHRAAHDVTVAGKQLAQAFYGAPVQHAYFDGCSTGGRMAMMEAERYPGDFDGIIAGDPNMDYHAGLLRFVVQKAAFASAASYLSPDTLRAVDKAVTALCDMLDGASDGLIQDPARCPVSAEELICHAGQTADCISVDQARVLHAYIGGAHDRHGHLLYPGMPISNLSGPRGISFWTTGETAPDLAHSDAPWGTEAKAPRGWVFARQALTSWLGLDTPMAKLDVDPRTGMVGDALVAVADRTFRDGETKDSAKLLAFIRQGRKLIIYHGSSDPALSPYRSIAFYQDLAARLHGIDKAQASVRLFLVPGMQHCSGGPGPDVFDTLSALEAWVEQGKAPDAIPAATKPDSAAPHRMPLCPYPRQARYQGSGAMTEAANWRCMSAR